MGGNNKEALQRENTIRFIEAAEELIDEQALITYLFVRLRESRLS